MLYWSLILFIISFSPLFAMQQSSESAQRCSSPRHRSPLHRPNKIWRLQKKIDKLDLGLTDSDKEEEIQQEDARKKSAVLFRSGKVFRNKVSQIADIKRRAEAFRLAKLSRVPTENAANKAPKAKPIRGSSSFAEIPQVSTSEHDRWLEELLGLTDSDDE